MKSKLGAFSTGKKWTFRVFSTRPYLNLLLFPQAEAGDYKSYKMQRSGEVFELSLEGEFEGWAYAYEYEGRLIVDPYAKYVSRGARRGILVSDKLSDPPGFRELPHPKLSFKDAIIYEQHIKDFSCKEAKCFRYPGKLLSLTESPSKEKLLGSDYMASLGVSHIHLLPLSPIMSLEEEEGYNWGYDPEFFFAFHRGYLVDVDRPLKALEEVKKSVHHLHNLGLGLVVDVVYNHTYHTEKSSFEALAPGYYYRMEEGVFLDGSGCGNELDSSKKYVRKLIIDSLVYLMEEFRVDGFRFDLWGLMEEDFAHEIVEVLRGINPQVLIYGEPWAANGRPDNFLHFGSQNGKDFALFNDRIRDGLRGKNDDKSLGFIQGSIKARNHVLTGIVGDIDYSQGIYGYCKEPWETINYMSCHDNMILYDKLSYSTGEDDRLVKKRVSLGFSIQLLSFGLPFIHAGTEFMRSKSMDHNSYKSGCSINGIDWKELDKHRDLVDLVRGLIALRRKFNLASYDSARIKKELYFYPDSPVIYYGLDLGEEELFIGHNPSLEKQKLPYDQAHYYLENFKVNLLGTALKKKWIAPLESVVLIRRKK
ncbi:MAG: type I pullulanase [Tissierellia bacterium]|nr:type I pullulanase [Tissierellia bacterium]